MESFKFGLKTSGDLGGNQRMYFIIPMIISANSTSEVAL